MIIQSKKTKIKQQVSESEWKMLKESGDSVHFNVLKRESELKTTPIPVKEVQEYMAEVRRGMKPQTDKIKDSVIPEDEKQIKKPTIKKQ